MRTEMAVMMMTTDRDEAQNIECSGKRLNQTIIPAALQRRGPAPALPALLRLRFEHPLHGDFHGEAAAVNPSPGKPAPPAMTR